MRARKGLKELEGLEVKCQKNRGEEFRVITDWDRKTPTDGFFYWHMNNITNDLRRVDLIEAFRLSSVDWSEAFSKGNLEIQVDSTSDKNKAHFQVYFAVNGDANLPYLFEDGVLGYALNDGRIFINDEWDFTLAIDPRGIKIRDLFTHELGHEFLIGHTDAPKDIMQPYIDPTGENHITSDSINALVAIYPEYIKEVTEDPQPVSETKYKEAFKTLRMSTSFRRLPKRTLQIMMFGLTTDEPFQEALIQLLFSSFRGKRYIMSLKQDVMLAMLKDLGYNYTKESTKEELYKVFHEALDVEYK